MDRQITLLLQRQGCRDTARPQTGEQSRRRWLTLELLTPKLFGLNQCKQELVGSTNPAFRTFLDLVCAVRVDKAVRATETILSQLFGQSTGELLFPLSNLTSAIRFVRATEGFYDTALTEAYDA